MEIIERDIVWGTDSYITAGSYLLKQTGKNTFETMSSFL